MVQRLRGTTRKPKYISSQRTTNYHPRRRGGNFPRKLFHHFHVWCHSKCVVLTVLQRKCSFHVVSATLGQHMDFCRPSSASQRIVCSIYARPTPYPLTCTPLARDIIFMLRGSMFPRGLAMYSYVYGGPPNLDYLKTRGAQRRYV